jgi:hypothetical protein
MSQTSRGVGTISTWPARVKCYKRSGRTFVLHLLGRLAVALCVRVSHVTCGVRAVEVCMSHSVHATSRVTFVRRTWKVCLLHILCTSRATHVSTTQPPDGPKRRTTDIHPETLMTFNACWPSTDCGDTMVCLRPSETRRNPLNWRRTYVLDHEHLVGKEPLNIWEAKVVLRTH